MNEQLNLSKEKVNFYNKGKIFWFNLIYTYEWLVLLALSFQVFLITHTGAIQSPPSSLFDIFGDSDYAALITVIFNPILTIIFLIASIIKYPPPTDRPTRELIYIILKEIKKIDIKEINNSKPDYKFMIGRILIEINTEEDEFATSEREGLSLSSPQVHNTYRKHFGPILVIKASKYIDEAFKKKKNKKKYN